MPRRKQRRSWGVHYDTPQGVQCSREAKNEKKRCTVLTICSTPCYTESQKGGKAVDTKKLGRSATLAVRTYPETKEKLKKLAEVKSKELGTKITQAQALEMCLAEALRDTK